MGGQGQASPMGIFVATQDGESSLLSCAPCSRAARQSLLDMLRRATTRLVNARGFWAGSRAISIPYRTCLLDRNTMRCDALRYIRARPRADGPTFVRGRDCVGSLAARSARPVSHSTPPSTPLGRPTSDPHKHPTLPRNYPQSLDEHGAPSSCSRSGGQIIIILAISLLRAHRVGPPCRQKIRGLLRIDARPITTSDEPIQNSETCKSVAQPPCLFCASRPRPHGPAGRYFPPL